jgi:hypothetical protein
MILRWLKKGLIYKLIIRFCKKINILVTYYWHSTGKKYKPHQGTSNTEFKDTLISDS